MRLTSVSMRNGLLTQESNRSPTIGKYFTMDPAFPSRILSHVSSSLSTTTSFQHCIIFLLEEYSRRNLSFPSDRPVAFAGLEHHIAQAFKTESRFGVMERHLHYNLMWEPSKSEKAASSLGRIRPSQGRRNHAAPSWSWMSYPEQIKIQRGMHLGAFNSSSSTSTSRLGVIKKDFFEDEDGLDVNSNVRFQDAAQSELLADLAVLVDCTIDPRGAHDFPGVDLNEDYVLRDSSGKLVGLVGFDYAGQDGDRERNLDGLFLVVLARFDGKFYVGFGGVIYAGLIVEAAGEGEAYRRIGTFSAKMEIVVRLEECVSIV